MNGFEKLFTELTKQHDNTVVFNDFLAYCVDQFRIDFHQPHFQRDKYNEDECSVFYDLFQYLIEHTNDELSKDGSVGWYDMLGVFYEDVVQSQWKAGNRGQFFTPVNVCEALAELTVPEDIPKDRVLTGYDSACGSSRTLLAYHVRRPFDILVGGDLDHTSCLMSVVNFVLHGVKGVIINMDSLSGEFFGAWKVNEFVDLGLPCTVEYLTDIGRVYNFIGEDFTGANDSVVEVEREVVAPVTVNGQTTLI